MINHTGTETTSRLNILASSEEYWTMNESLIQQYYLNDDGYFGCKILSLEMIMTLFKEVIVPANLGPAAAVIREGRALFGITGRKGFVGCIIS